MRHEPTNRAGRRAPAASSVRLQDEIDQLRLENEQLLETVCQLELERDFYVDAFQANPTACLVLDRQGVVRALGAVAAHRLGQSPPQLTGRAFRSLVEEDDRPIFLRHLERCAREPGLVGTELHIVPPGGKPFPVELWSGRMEHHQSLYPSVLVDITDRLAARVERRSLRAAEQAARAESEAKDQFITSVSHELRTPLTPVLAAVSALTLGATAPAPSRQLLEMIKRNVLAEARLIDDLLDAARIRRGKLRVDRHPMDVHEAVRQSVEVLAAEARRKGIEIQVELEAARHHVSGDPLRLRQVFWNLFGNALKFTPERGWIGVRSWNRGALVAVEVSDSGVGVAPDELERLFRPFEQGPTESRGSGGLGLGLAIARGVVDLHGGRIVGASEGPGRGARFVVELDSISAPAAPPAEPVRAAAEVHPHRRILLVEDHQDTADSLAELLAAEGYQVEKAASAASALAVDLDRVDLVVSDLGLPDGSGHELVRKLRARRRLPAIALSGYGTESDVRSSQEAGFSAHLTKPVDWPELLATIQRVG